MIQHGTLAEKMTMRRKGIGKNAGNASDKREWSPPLRHPWRPSPSLVDSGSTYAAVERIPQAVILDTTTKKVHTTMNGRRNASGPEREYVSSLMGHD
jgi:hypothetical protein